MKVLEIPYSEHLPDIVQLSGGEFEHALKMALASKLFELGRLTSGQAAEIAGLSRVAFLRELSQYRVNAVDWDPGEFNQEVKNA